MTLPEYKEKKTWQFWCVWEGYRTHLCVFNDSGLKDLEKITYSEYKERLISVPNHTFRRRKTT